VKFDDRFTMQLGRGNAGYHSICKHALSYVRIFHSDRIDKVTSFLQVKWREIAGPQR
jgi:hypothetical protein